MLDWFTGTLAFDAKNLKPDVVYRVDRDGNIVWSHDCWVEVEGSYSDKMQLRSISNPPLELPNRSSHGLEILSTELLQLSGNPTKFLQGHNAFGVSVCELDNIIKATVNHLPEVVRPIDSDLDRVPIVRKSRIDIATMINLGSHEDVHNWLHSIATASRSRHGRALVSGDTVYWGKHSRRWTMKAYCKYCEMAEHGMGDRKRSELVREFVKGQLRLELTLRGQELKEISILSEDVLWHYFDRIEVGVFEMNRVKDVDCLPLAMQASFLRWLAGEDVRMIMTKPRFYRHRRRIMDELGVDIHIPANGQKVVLEHLRFDGKYLREKEVKTVPNYLDMFIYKPKDQLAFCMS